MSLRWRICPKNGGIPSISMSLTGGATSFRRHRPVAGCSLHRLFPVSASHSIRAPRCSGSRKGCRDLSHRENAREQHSRPASLFTEDGTALAFGTPGGDQQDQWQLALFLRLAHHERNLQAALDMPLFHTTHFPASFHPRPETAGSHHGGRELRHRYARKAPKQGHSVEVADEWTIGRLTVAARDPGGLMRAGATPRLMQAYAAGR